MNILVSHDPRSAVNCQSGPLCESRGFEMLTHVLAAIQLVSCNCPQWELVGQLD